MTYLKILLSLGLLLASPSHAVPSTPQSLSATQKPSISPIISAFLVSPTGLLPIEATTTIQSGDLVEYHAYLPNHSSSHIASMTVTLEIPNGVTFAHQSTPQGATASTNNLDFGTIPLQANLGGQTQNVPERFYRSLRWVITDVGMGEVAVVKYQALVN